jgi:hypothetical protein
VNFGSLRAAAPSREVRGGLAIFIRRLLIAAITALVVAAAGRVHAAPVKVTVTGSVNFPESDPDLVPVIGPQTITLDFRAVGQRGRRFAVTLVANGDLTSGPDVIPASAISWVAYPSQFASGRLSTTIPVLIVEGLTHAMESATFDFYLDNSWDYYSGVYSGSATYTISSP